MKIILKNEFKQDKQNADSNIQSLIEKGNDLVYSDIIITSEDDKIIRKFNFLKLIRQQQRNEILELHKDIVKLENESSSRLIF